MQAMRGHAPVRDVLQAAGIHVPLPAPAPPAASTVEGYAAALRGWEPEVRQRRGDSLEESGAGRASMDGARSSVGDMTHEEEAEWMRQRTQSLERLRTRKEMRRGAFVGYGGARGGALCGSENGHCSPVAESEEERGEVLVIGFEREEPEEEEISPTGATEDSSVLGEGRVLAAPVEEEEDSVIHDTHPGTLNL